MRSCLTACMLCMSSLTCIPSPSAELVGPSEDSEGRPGECLSQKSTTCLVDRRNAEEKELWNKAVERRTELKRINGNLATVEKELESLKKRPGKDGKAASLKGLNNEKMDLVKKREQLAAEAVTEIRALHVTTQIRRALEQVSSHRGAAAEMHVLQTLKMANQTRYRRGAHGLWKQPVKEAVTDIFGLNELQKAHQATSRGARAHSELLVIEAVTEICTLRFTRQTRHILAQGCVHLRRHIIGILLRRHILCRKVRHAHRRRYTSRVRQTNHAGHILPHTHPTHEEASQVLTHSPNASQVNASQVLTHSPNPCEGKSNCAQSFAIPCNEYVHVYGLGHQTSMNNRQCIFSDVGQKCTALFSTRTFWQQGSRRKAYKDCKREGWALPLVKHNCTDSGLEGPRMRIDKCPKD
ncbi:hypothetical protein DUNSADRAFT_2606 [Dunaliella salina]|uniref:Uncharacterized protein n=1 Tax=Dunaliella salina TaxID=3046 RepID=A0ABQ7GVA6_DUNSA|nr:hypothetical protein DUNSADRAFT_2606 [Dunaliella salina]|eukprot:KAF5838545.1 hypothetical protein DUNSADRAFT_2606 [Dunaliella salina]